MSLRIISRLKNHVERIETCFVSDNETELPVQRGQQGDDRHSRREQPEHAMAEEPDRIGIASERTGENKTAQDKERDDGAEAI